MASSVRSVWDGVPDAITLKQKLAVAKDPQQRLRDRQDAISYLTGAVKVMARLESRALLVEYLSSRLRTIKATLYT